VELLEAFLSVLLTGLSTPLAIVALLAHRYLSDRRFVLVGIGPLGLASVGVRSFPSISRATAGNTMDDGGVPLAVLVGVILLLNASPMLGIVVSNPLVGVFNATGLVPMSFSSLVVWRFGGPAQPTSDVPLVDGGGEMSAHRMEPVNVRMTLSHGSAHWPSVSTPSVRG
jgi:hypothetical protein